MIIIKLYVPISKWQYNLFLILILLAESKEYF